MALPSDLVKEFAQITINDKNAKKETTVYGTVKKYGNALYVQLDGSDMLTPVETTSSIKDGDRVMVLIKNHSATVTGNISKPSTNKDDVKEEVGNQIEEFGHIVTDRITAAEGEIDNLQADNVVINNKLTANEGEFNNLKADYGEFKELTTGNFEATNGKIENLETKKLDTEVADIAFAKIGDLEATNADIHNLKADYGEFKNLTTDKISANEANIKDLEAKKLSVEDANIKFANIDFANIGKAAIENLFSKSGMIGDLVVGEGTITGTLVGVTIKGDLIEGGTVVADKLVIKGDNGLYYKLNTDGEKVGAEQTEYNSLNGSILTAKSVTAEKISVKDLVAFGATIGGFHITDSSLYSGVKESATNTTRGVFLGDDGQFAVGDAVNYLKFFKDTDGKFKLAISAASLKFGSTNKDVEEELEEAKKTATNYLNFSGGGLIVGDMTKTTLGNNILIDSDSVDIRNGENKLASFGANKIELGIGNQQSNIYFCNDSGYINYDARDFGDLGIVTGLGLTSNNDGIQLISHAAGSDKGSIDLVVDDLKDSKLTTRSLLKISDIFRFYREKMYSSAGTATIKDNIDFILQPSSSWLHLQDKDGGWFNCTLTLDDLNDYTIDVSGSGLSCNFGGTLEVDKLWGNKVVVDYIDGRSPELGITASTLVVQGESFLELVGGTCGMKLGHGNEINFTGRAQVGTRQYPAGGVNIANYNAAYTANNAAGNGKINLIWATSGNHVQIGGGGNPIPGNIYLKTGRAVQILTEDPVSTTDTGIIFSVRNSGTSGGSTTSKDGIFFATGCDADGGFIRSYYTYARTYTSSANLYITSSGTFGRHASSSRKYKTDIISIDDNLKKHTSQNFMDDRLNIEPIIDPHGLYDIPVMQYKYIDGYLASEDANVGKDVIGIIAEDVAQFYPQAAIYDEKGVPEAWNSEPVLVGLLYLVQEQKKEIEAIKQQLKGIIK